MDGRDPAQDQRAQGDDALPVFSIWTGRLPHFPQKAVAYSKLPHSTGHAPASLGRAAWIGCAETFPQHIALPRGCLEPVQTLLRDLGIGWELVDERHNGSLLELMFAGQLRADQEAAVEAMLRQVKARYVLGLSATLVRRDGLQPILFMQCGPIRHIAQRPAGSPQILELVSRTHQLEGLPTDLPIQELMRRLAEDPHRTDRIVAEALACWAEGRKLLLLSERTDPITAIATALADQVPNLFLLHGRLSARQRSATLAALEALPPDAPRIVVATGRLVGEGFDHPLLNTLLLALPVSWKGTLQQYAGRLHRQQAGKTSVRIIDWLDLGHPVPQRMWERRLRGFRAMGYALISDPRSTRTPWHMSTRSINAFNPGARLRALCCCTGSWTVQCRSSVSPRPARASRRCSIASKPIPM
jgi:hypothetical protein